jgi:GT2 family glycosyltransferase
LQRLSIIIVNYNAKNFIADCIISAMQYPSAQTFEWIVVDNNSIDNSKEQLTEKFPFIKWIDMGYNAGFARANNAGIKAAEGHLFLLLNPDTIIVNDCIKNCVDLFDSDTAIACSVQLMNIDHSPQITGNYFMKGGLNQLLPLPYLGKFLRNIAFAFNSKKTNVLSASARQKVDWINGAFLMVKKSAVEKAGLLDEDFFLYAEEAEWCWRLGKHGELVVYGDLNIIHLQGEVINAEAKTSGKGYFDLYSKKGLQLMVSNLLRIRKQYGIGWYLFNLLIYVVEIPVFFVFNFFDNIIHFKNPFENWQLVKKFSKNVFTLITLTPLITKSKNFFFKMM